MPALLDLDDPFLDRELDQAGAGMDLELFAEVGLVGNNRFGADCSGCRPLLVGVALGDELQHLFSRSVSRS